MEKKTTHQRPSRNTLDACFAGAPVVLYLRRRESPHPLAYVSPNILALLGHPREAFEDNTDFWADCLHPDDRQRLKEGRLGPEKTPGAATEYRLRDGQGNYRWIRDEPDTRPASGEDQFLAGYWQDITAQRAPECPHPSADSPLRLTDPVAQGLLDKLPQHLFWKDANGVFQGCNRAGADAFGLARPQDIAGKTDFDLYPDPALAGHLHYQDVDILRSGTVQVHDVVPALGPNGEKTWLDLTKAAIYGIKGQIQGLLISYQDITEQMAAEAALRQFKQAVEQSSNTIIITDTTGAIAYVNPQFIEVYGYAAEEALGRNPSLLKSGHTSLETYQAMWSALWSGNCWHGEFLNRCKDGSLVWQVATLSPLVDEKGQITHFIAIEDDISGQKRVEASLRDSEERFHRLVDLTEEGILIHDGQRILDANPALARLLGYSSEELAKLPLLDLAPEAYHRRIRSAIRQQRTTPYEIKCLRKDGSEFDVEIIGKPITYHEQPARVAAVRDISQRKALEQNLARLSRRHATLSRINQIIVYCRDEATLFKEACQALVETGQMMSCWIGLVDKETRRVKPAAYRGAARNYIKHLHIDLGPASPSGQGPIGTVVAEGQPYLCNDFAADPRTEPWHESAEEAGIRALAVYPLRRDGETVGTLSVYAGEVNFFSESHATLLQEIADNLSFALDSLDQQRQRLVAEKSLQESEERFRAIANYTYNWENWIDPKGKLQWINPAVERFTGYTPEECHAMENYPLDLIYEEDRDIVRQHFQRAVGGESGTIPEFRFVRKDGAVRWGMVEWQNIYDSAGHSLGHRSSVRDITEQKLAVNRLFEAQQMLQLVLDHVPQRIFWKDVDFVYRGGNRTFLKDLRLNDSTELKGHTDFDFFPPELARSYRADDHEVMAKETPKVDYEEFTLFPGLGHRHILTSKLPIRDAAGKVIGVLGSYTDITEWRQSQEQLHNTLKELQTILDNAQAGIALVRDHHFVWVNRHLLEMFGYPFGQAQDQPASLFNCDDEAEKIGLDSAPFSPLDNSIQEHELRMKRRDGSTFWCHLRGSVLDPDAPEKGSIWIILDIDQLKRVEAELRQLNETLEQRVKEQTDKSLEQERLLIQQSRHAAMGEMIGNIAHQWRQPLNALGLVVQNALLDYRDGTLSADAMENYATKALSMIQQMSTTIDDFRNFFRPSRAAHRYNLVQSIREALNLMEAGFKNHNITATLAGPEEVIAWGHPNEFAQIILNLVSNAKDALMEKEALHGRIAIHVSASPDEALITVEDNAGGIPSGIQEKLFDPYFTTKANGTGIGLYMVKTILQKHMAGQISFRNTREGTEFRITLPLRPPPAIPGKN